MCGERRANKHPPERRSSSGMSRNTLNTVPFARRVLGGPGPGVGSGSGAGKWLFNCTEAVKRTGSSQRCRVGDERRCRRRRSRAVLERRTALPLRCVIAELLCARHRAPRRRRDGAEVRARPRDSASGVPTVAGHFPRLRFSCICVPVHIDRPVLTVC